VQLTPSRMNTCLFGSRYRQLRLLLVVLLGIISVARAQVVFVTDEQGRVGRFNTATNTGTSLGSLAASGFSAMQVIGMAYDPASDSVLLFDRNAGKVYSMNAVTGVTTVLFSTPGVSFQGGAVVNNTVFGIDEGAQTLAAYSFTGTKLTLSGTVLPDHTHNLGVNPVTGELFTMSNSGVRVINQNGTLGPVLLSGTAISALNPEDVAYFNGNYLAATYTTSLTMVNGTTGAQTTFLNSAQLSSMGVTGSLSGVAVQLSVIPEPGTWAMVLAGSSAIAVSTVRRRRRPS
jgi:hypothetical protein